MAYTPNPLDPTEPEDTVEAKTAAAEFRALKLFLQQSVMFAGINSGGIVHAGDSAPFNPLTAGATEIVDTQAEFAAGVFTAKIAGYYYVETAVQFVSQSNTIPASCSVSVFKNGAQAPLISAGVTALNILDSKQLRAAGYVHLAIGDTVSMSMLATVPQAIIYSLPQLSVCTAQKG